MIYTYLYAAVFNDVVDTYSVINYYIVTANEQNKKYISFTRFSSVVFRVACFDIN